MLGNQFSSIPDPDALSPETFVSVSLLASGRDSMSLQGPDGNMLPPFRLGDPVDPADPVAPVSLPVLFRYMVMPLPEVTAAWLPMSLSFLPVARIP